MDRDVTEPIEDAIQGSEGLTGTTADSSEGVSIIQVRLRLRYGHGRHPPGATAADQQAQSQLPEDVSPTVTAGSSDDLPIMTPAATSSGDEQRLARDLENIVGPERESVDGVGEVSVR